MSELVITLIFILEFRKTVEEESYSPKKVFYVDETGPSATNSLASPLAIGEYNILSRVTCHSD